MKFFAFVLALTWSAFALNDPMPYYQAPWGAAITGGVINPDSVNAASLVLRNQGPGYLIQSSLGAQVTDLNCSSGQLAAFSVGGSTTWYAIANNGTTLARGGASGSIQTTTDGSNLTQRSSGITSLIAAGTYGLSRYIMVGTTSADSTNGISVSSDAATWSPVKSINASRPYRSVACNTGMCLIGGTSSTLISTTNFSTFTAQTYGGTSGTIQVLVWSPTLSLWVGANGAGAIRTSPDGVTWTSRTSGVATALYAGVWDSVNSLFVVVGAGGVILTSPNGTTWTARTSGTTRDLFAVYYGGGKVVAAGDSLRILTSTNSTSWTSASIPADDREFDAGSYVGTTHFLTGEGGISYSSPDAVTWARVGQVQPACLTPSYLTRDSIPPVDSVFIPNGQGSTINFFGNSLVSSGGSWPVFPEILSAKYNFLMVNQGDGSGVEVADDGIIGRAYRQAYSDSSISVSVALENDMTRGNNRSDAARTEMALGAVQAVPDYLKKTDTAAIYTGVGWVVDSLYSRRYRKTSTAADYVTFTTTGTAFVIGTLIKTSTGGVLSVTVDGVSKGNISCLQNSATNHGITLSPAAYVISGLTAGVHTVRLTAVSGTVYYSWSYGGATPRSLAILGGTSPVPDSTAANWVSNADTFTTIHRDNATALRLVGLNVKAAPYKLDYANCPTATPTPGEPCDFRDNRHPDSIGAAKIADSIWAVITRATPQQAFNMVYQSARDTGYMKKLNPTGSGPFSMVDSVGASVRSDFLNKHTAGNVGACWGSNGSTSGVCLRYYGSTYSPSGMFEAGFRYLYTSAGPLVVATQGFDPIYITMNGTKYARFYPTGHFVFGYNNSTADSGRTLNVNGTGYFSGALRADSASARTANVSGVSRADSSSVRAINATGTVRAVVVRADSGYITSLFVNDTNSYKPKFTCDTCSFTYKTTYTYATASTVPVFNSTKGIVSLASGGALSVIRYNAANTDVEAAAPTGTGAPVNAASPTLSGTIGGALTWSGTQTFSNRIYLVTANASVNFNMSGTSVASGTSPTGINNAMTYGTGATAAITGYRGLITSQNALYTTTGDVVTMQLDPFVKGASHTVSGSEIGLYIPTQTATVGGSHIAIKTGTVGDIIFGIGAGTGNRPACFDTNGKIYAGTNVATVLACP